MIYEKEHPQVQNILSNPVTVIDPLKNDLTIGTRRYIRWKSIELIGIFGFLQRIK